MDKLDIYRITIDETQGDDLGINLISFVKNPAIMVKGFAFNNQEKPSMKYFSSDVKMRIVAPALIPMDIYRFDSESNYEYEVQFTVDVIEQIRNKFMANLSNKNIFNLEHSEEIVPAYILETWIVGQDPKADKSYSEFGIEVPTGTMMVMSQITDKNYYDSLIENQQFAYSIEGFFGLDELKLMIDKKQETKMNDLTLPDGEHRIGEKIYVIKDGKIAEIKDIIEAGYEEPIEEVMSEDIVEETMEEAPIEEEPIEEAPIEEETMALAIDETELMTILQPKFDEIYKLIADLKAQVETDVEEDSTETETITETVSMSINERFSQINNFLKKK